jgi:hypothetical protein
MIDHYLLFRVPPCGGGNHLPFIGQGEGDLQACRTISLRVVVWRTVTWS